MADFHSYQDFFANGVEQISASDLPEDSRECPLCFETYESVDQQTSTTTEEEPTSNAEIPLRIRMCAHVFGNRCLLAHVSGAEDYCSTCPLCRRDLYAAPLHLGKEDILYYDLLHTLQSHRLYMANIARATMNNYLMLVRQNPTEPSYLLQVLRERQKLSRALEQIREYAELLQVVQERIRSWVAMHGFEALLEEVIEAMNAGAEFFEAWDAIIGMDILD